MNFWMDCFTRIIRGVKRVDVITINDEEARQFQENILLLRLLQNSKWDLSICNQKEKQATVFTKKCMFFAPALPLEEVFDPTGAGDTFAGVLQVLLHKAKFHLRI
jgi:sugar/nucleoside kinase (ribokinase family)